MDGIKNADGRGESEESFEQAIARLDAETQRQRELDSPGHARH